MDGKTGKDKLPGNHGQFGAGDATEAYKPLDDHPAPEPSSPEPPINPQGDPPQQTHAGDRS